MEDYNSYFILELYTTSLIVVLFIYLFYLYLDGALATVLLNQPNSDMDMQVKQNNSRVGCHARTTKIKSIWIATVQVSP
jgi:hypothetical protein